MYFILIELLFNKKVIIFCVCKLYKYLFRKLVQYWPNMYIIVKQLSKAMPTRNLQTQNDQKVVQNVVAIPPMNPAMLVPTRAGILPNLSAIHPKTNPPNMAPQKKIDCAVEGRAEFSQTQFC